jgi:hypothetical protein
MDFSRWSFVESERVASAVKYIPGWSPSFRCRDCGSSAGFHSRPRTLVERYVLPVFLLQPVRCGDCFRRDYRLVFTPVRDSPLSGQAG